jgi:guanine deaminase
MSETVIIGQTLAFEGDPFREGWEAVVRHRARGGVLVRDGRIAATGEADDLRRAHPGAQVVDHGAALVSAGFVDAHMHYPQTGIIASWGKRLIDWLNLYTCPEEMRLADPAYAAEVAGRSLDLCLDHGTTTVASFCTIHEGSVDALFAAAAARGMGIVAGRTCMDRETAPAGLRDSARAAVEESARLIGRWHRKGRAVYAITPRFSPTSTEEQLEGLGALWAAHPDCLMQTHLSEQVDEIAWMRSLYPWARDYLDSYERFGLLGARGVYGHAIHLEPREIARLTEVGAAVVHCPTSNSFIGSGLFDLTGLAPVMRVGLATDTGGGSSFSMLRTMAAAYEVAQLRGVAVHPAELWWLATEGSARALGMGGEVGALRAGAMADIVVVDLASTPAIAQRARRAAAFWDAVFPTIMMGDDRAIREVRVAGRVVRG